MNLYLQAYELQLKNPFNITHGSRKSQPTLILTLEKEGIKGYGEAVAVSYYGLDIASMKATFEARKAQLEKLPLESPEAYWQLAQPIMEGHPFLHCALDVAVHDWFAKKAGLPLYQYWGLTPKSLPPTSFTIGMDDIPVMVKKLQEMPWPVYKIKLGKENDLEVIQALRQYTDATFRVDANTGWSLDQARYLIPRLKELGVDMIEQPMKVSDWEAMKELKAASPLPLMADESCQTESDVERCAPCFHGINIKVMKCGGLTPALRMIRQARSMDMQVMVGCMIQSSVGISAIAHLLPLIDYADMDSGLMISNDPGDGVDWKDGQVIYQDRPGTGVMLKA
jgi:L-alanine-DL-glutamate epimerase-like enolase superfamily enzyme